MSDSDTAASTSLTLLTGASSISLCHKYNDNKGFLFYYSQLKAFLIVCKKKKSPTQFTRKELSLFLFSNQGEKTASHFQFSFLISTEVAAQQLLTHSEDNNLIK